MLETFSFLGYIFIGLYFWFFNILFCGWLAGQKNYSSFSWGVLAFLFGFLATIVMVGAPKVEKVQSPQKEEDPKILV